MRMCQATSVREGVAKLSVRITRVAWATLWLAAVLIPLSRGADRWTLDPQTLRSPSGEFELLIMPSDPNGQGPGTYQMKRGETVVWTGKRSLTLREARVLDDGRAVGYAYEGGVRSPGHHGVRYTGLTVVMFDASGEFQLRDPASEHGWGRDPSDMSHSDSPAVSGMVVDVENDRFILRVHPRPFRQSGGWWTYRLSTGEKLGDVLPRPSKEGGIQLIREFSAEHVPGTPFTLVHWYVQKYGRPQVRRGALLALLDAEYTPVWEYELPQEYDAFDEKQYWYQLFRSQVGQAKVAARAFSFLSNGESARLDFAVVADPEAPLGLSVEEVRRTGKEFLAPFNEEVVVSSETRQAWPKLTLKSVGEITLQVPQVATVPVAVVRDFQLDAQGNLGLVGKDEFDQLQFVLLNQDGGELAKHELTGPEFGPGGTFKQAPGRGGAWLLIRNTFNDESPVFAWWIDPSAGTTRRIEDFVSARVETLEPTPHGGFLLLVSHRLEYTSQDEIRCYDADLKLLWSRREPGYGRGFSFKAATPRASGGAVALVNSGRKLVYLDAHGRDELVVELDDVLGERLNYATGLTLDWKGGLVLRDFRGKPPVYRLSASRAVLAKFQPRFDDGRTFSIVGGVRCAPDGRLWTSDGHALLRLDETGVVDFVVGRRPDQISLESINAMTVDRKGQIYAVDERTSDVFVFSREGKSLGVWRPDPTDFPERGWRGTITVDHEGVVAYQNGARLGDGENRGYLRFSSSGERLGFEARRFTAKAETWLEHPSTPKRWTLGRKEIYLSDSEGELLRKIRRRPDGTWLRNIRTGAVAPDGSLAVASNSIAPEATNPMVVSIYDADGDGLGTWTLPDGIHVSSLAFHGKTIALATDANLLLYDVMDGPVGDFQLRLPGGMPGWWKVFFSPEGNEVWLRNGDEKVLRRYLLR